VPTATQNSAQRAPSIGPTPMHVGQQASQLGAESVDGQQIEAAVHSRPQHHPVGVALQLLKGLAQMATSEIRRVATHHQQGTVDLTGRLIDGAAQSGAKTNALLIEVFDIVAQIEVARRSHQQTAASSATGC